MRGPAECGVLCVAGKEGGELGPRPRQSGAHAVPTPGLLSPWAPALPPASERAAPHLGAPAAAGPTDWVTGKAVAGHSSGPGQGGNREAGVPATGRTCARPWEGLTNPREGSTVFRRISSLQP